MIEDFWMSICEEDLIPFRYNQVVVLAKNKHIQDLLAANNISVRSLKEVTSIEVHPARVLSHLYAVLGKLIMTSHWLFNDENPFWLILYL